MLWHAPHNCTESAGRVPERAESQLRPVNFPKSQTSLVTPSNKKKNTHTRTHTSPDQGTVLRSLRKLLHTYSN